MAISVVEKIVNQQADQFKDVRTYRRLLMVAGVTYGLWWFAVRILLPNAFNPFESRFLLVFGIFTALLLSYRSRWVRRHIGFLFFSIAWLITFHYYYLFYYNDGDPNWMVGAFVTVLAISLCFFSFAALLSYSIFVVALSVVFVLLLPSLEYSVFLPGLLTILLQANLALYFRLKTIRNLEESNQKFQLLFHSTFDGVLVHEDGIIQNANESLTEISGFSYSELIGKSVLDIIEPSERKAVAEKLGRSEVAPYQTRGVRKDGRIVEIEVRAKNFSHNGRVARLVAVQDISDRKKVEAERIRSLTLTENVKLRDEFISIASHELKTPISALKLQTQIIEYDLMAGTPQNPVAVREITTLLHRQINRLTELVETMLDVSRISSGRFLVEKQSLDLATIVREVVETHAAQHPHLSIRLNSPESVLMQGDRRRLEQVIENILNNAIKYGANKPVQIRIEEGPASAVVTIEDQGVGIEPDFLPRIFDRFERGVSAINISGLGLGLYITKRIVDEHRGDIQVESQPDHGSKFIVTLPLS